MTASEDAYRRLREDIVSWRRAPGSPLAETELAAELGVSRTPLRAALARLALEGLVDTRRKTAAVSPVSADGIRHLFELREALEVHAVRLAAERRDPAVFAALGSRLSSATALIRDGRIDDYYAIVADLDAAVDIALDNEALRSALDNVRVHLARARRRAADDADRLERSVQEHRLICDAIRDGQPTLAAAATVVHLHASLDHLLAHLEAPAREGIR